ncbi:signal recognition particle-docking protein FtsY [Nocardia sp. CS682]|uniref:signal recognition particle-docking protein FtsY n=1 Tax=Nocardia sp. CS682 TaxID=1047172 RepID=UPI00107536B4|nr:signal recognition particle-docking protein FtsY [Nocardia sp. CS682]QBS40436.1 signal recognition particle-docking protein FtsY [Nocardia sp. CS682]
MSAEAWILIAVAAALLLVVLVVGFVRYKRSRVSLTPPAADKELTDKSGGYAASGGFSFSQGGTATKPEPLSVERTDTDGQPHVGDDAAIPRDAHKRGITNVPLPEADIVEAPETESAGADTAADTETAPMGTAGSVEAGSETASAGPSTASAGSSATAAESDAAAAEPGTAATGSGAAAAESGTAPVESGTAPAESATAESSTTPAESATTAADSGTTPAGPKAPTGPTKARKGTGTAPSGTDATAAGTAPAAPDTAAGAEAPIPLEDIDPTAGRLVRLRGRLSRSQNAVGKSLLGLLGGGDLDDESWEEVEDTLVLADLGTASTAAVVARLRAEMASRSVRTTEAARAVLRDVLIEALRPELDRSIRALPHPDHPSILLVVGVNGTGKTTTTGKLARVLVADGRRVLLGAADTFRAAAADQLQTWGERVGADTIRGKESADPAAVAFDAVTAGIERGVDAVLIDTAGRLHTKTGLMDELGKVKRVVEKKAAVDEVLLVLDATVGQNGLMQARVFAEVVDITGVVLTKLDGTAKGGIVFQVQHELGVPVKLVGLGEGADDLAPFEPGAFVDALLG